MSERTTIALIFLVAVLAAMGMWTCNAGGLALATGAMGGLFGLLKGSETPKS